MCYIKRSYTGSSSQCRKERLRLGLALIFWSFESLLSLHLNIEGEIVHVAAHTCRLGPRRRHYDTQIMSSLLQWKGLL